MKARNGAAAAQAASASASLRADQGEGGRYPFTCHKTVAEVWADCGPIPCVDGVWRLEDQRIAAVCHQLDGFVFIPVLARIGAAEVVHAG